jgi:DNA (cytosine-5)-methyltransferase 1
MIYGSVCSGIEAATVAWHPLGWTPKFFSEIEAFPSAVLAHRYGSNMPGEPLTTNGIPNHGDFTQISADAGPVDLLVGGTPCQSFSVAGKRLGLDDPRGNLALEYLALAKRLGARWFVWENVPGVLSSRSDDGSYDFATFLSFVRQCGYGFAYRVLDAQYVRVDGYARAVPQRRRRVVVVGYLGDWRIAAAVLLEREGMRWDPAPRRETGQRAAGAVTASSGRRGGTDDPERGKLIAEACGGGNASGRIDVSTALTAHGRRQDFEVETFIAEVAATLPAGGNGTGGDRQPGTGAETAASMLIAFNSREDPEVTFDRSGPLGASGPQAKAIAYGLRSDAARSGEAASESIDAAGVARKRDAGFNVYEEHAPTLDAGGPHSVAFDLRGREGGSQFEGPHETANIRAGSGGSSRSYVSHQWNVRRLVPVECERLQGFRDGYTDVPWRGKPTAPDGPRYKACGNSMAVNFMRWIGMRIDIMEDLIRSGRISP